MKRFDRVLVAITNDEYEHIVGLWESIKLCAMELRTSADAIRTKICRKGVDRKLNARFEWMVLEDESK